jgi:uncharacterized protein YaaW (UPF0174 family)
MAKLPNDKELEFLKTCTADELAPLVGIILGTKDGEIDKSGRLTSELQSTQNFKKFYPDHTKYVDEMIEEIQKFGGNTIVNFFRGHFGDRAGVPYHEILCDCADKKKVNFNKFQETEKIEAALLDRVLRDSWDRLSEEERAKMLEELGVPDLGGIGASALVQLLRAGGFQTYRIALIVVNAIATAIFGHGLKLVANVFLVRCIAVLTGPIGWILTGGWAVLDAASPAYRVTIPACIYIAALRLMKTNEAAALEASQQES